MANVEALRVQVRSLYKAYRDALLNRRYYGYRLNTSQRWNRALELTLAVLASGSVANWLIWREGVGEVVWGVLTGATTLLAIAKPVINLSADIERYTKLFTSHGDVAHDLERVVANVTSTQAFGPEAGEMFDKALDRQKELSGLDDARPNKKLVKRCFNEVNLQVPPNTFWMPKDEEQGNGRERRVAPSGEVIP